MKKLILLIALGSMLSIPSFAGEVKTPEEKLKDLGITLLEETVPRSNYVKTVQVGKTLYLAGHLPLREDRSIIKGKLGKNLSIEDGYHASRRAGINMISTLKHALGDLSRVKKIVRLYGMVNATQDFVDHPKVINGASDVFVEVFGEKVGKHTRAAVGMASLPVDMAVELELIVEIKGKE